MTASGSGQNLFGPTVPFANIRYIKNARLRYRRKERRTNHHVIFISCNLFACDAIFRKIQMNIAKTLKPIIGEFLSTSKVRSNNVPKMKKTVNKIN